LRTRVWGGGQGLTWLKNGAPHSRSPEYWVEGF